MIFGPKLETSDLTLDLKTETFFFANQEITIEHWKTSIPITTIGDQNRWTLKNVPRFLIYFDSGFLNNIGQFWMNLWRRLSLKNTVFPWSKKEGKKGRKWDIWRLPFILNLIGERVSSWNSDFSRMPATFWLAVGTLAGSSFYHHFPYINDALLFEKSNEIFCWP